MGDFGYSMALEDPKTRRSGGPTTAEAGGAVRTLGPGSATGAPYLPDNGQGLDFSQTSHGCTMLVRRSAAQMGKEDAALDCNLKGVKSAGRSTEGGGDGSDEESDDDKPADKGHFLTQVYQVKQGLLLHPYANDAYIRHEVEHARYGRDHQHSHKPENAHDVGFVVHRRVCAVSTTFTIGEVHQQLRAGAPHDKVCGAPMIPETMYPMLGDLVQTPSSDHREKVAPTAVHLLDAKIVGSDQTCDLNFGITIPGTHRHTGSKDCAVTAVIGPTTNTSATLPIQFEEARVTKNWFAKYMAYTGSELRNSSLALSQTEKGLADSYLVHVVLAMYWRDMQAVSQTDIATAKDVAELAKQEHKWRNPTELILVGCKSFIELLTKHFDRFRKKMEILPIDQCNVYFVPMCTGGWYGILAELTKRGAMCTADEAIIAAHPFTVTVYLYLEMIFPRLAADVHRVCCKMAVGKQSTTDV